MVNHSSDRQLTRKSTSEFSSLSCNVLFHDILYVIEMQLLDLFILFLRRDVLLRSTFIASFFRLPIFNHLHKKRFSSVYSSDCFKFLFDFCILHIRAQKIFFISTVFKQVLLNVIQEKHLTFLRNFKLR